MQENIDRMAAAFTDLGVGKGERVALMPVSYTHLDVYKRQIFYCEGCGEAIIDPQVIDVVAHLFAREGSDAWYAREAAEILPPGFKCSGCGGGSFRKERDTMDVWFDSGTSHFAVLEGRPELRWPADLYLEGSDQYLSLIHI